MTRIITITRYALALPLCLLYFPLDLVCYLLGQAIGRLIDFQLREEW